MSDESPEESVVQIDENELDRECIRLPSDYLKFAHLAADAKRDADESKAQLDVIEAELAKEIRSDPDAFNIEKLTEATLSATIILQSRYQKARGRWAQAKHKADLNQAVVWALEHKKRTLTLLVELHGMGYFSSPKISEKGREAVDEMTRKKIHRKFRDDD